MLVGAWLAARYRVPLDFDVYRTAALFWLHGGNVYAQLPFLTEGGHLPFTYPPFALLIFLPSALVSLSTGFFFLAVASVAILSIMLKRVVASGELAWYALVTAALSVWCEPVAETFSLGQINLVLLGLGYLALTSPRARAWGCVGLGIAAAVKLTPAALALWFVVRRDWRGMGCFAIAASACIGIGYIILPAESKQYWLTTLWDPARIGNLSFAGNQSLNGMIRRLGGGSVAWVIAVVICGLVIYVTARALYMAGNERLAMIPVILFPLLASPVSWSHHWVWGGGDRDLVVDARLPPSFRSTAQGLGRDGCDLDGRRSTPVVFRRGSTMVPRHDRGARVVQLRPMGPSRRACPLP